jgi:hypothetical protein
LLPLKGGVAETQPLLFQAYNKNAVVVFDDKRTES